MQENTKAKKLSSIRSCKAKTFGQPQKSLIALLKAGRIEKAGP